MDFQAKLPNNIANTRRPKQAIREQVTKSRYKNKTMDFGYSYAKDLEGANKNKDIGKTHSLEYDKKMPPEINIWRHRNTSNPDFYDNTKNNSQQILSDSLQTNTSGKTYDVIDVFPQTQSRLSRAQPRQVKKVKKRQPRVNCRVIKVVAVIFVLLVLGIIAFFIVRNLIGEDTPEDSCDKLSTVDNGTVSMSNGSKTIVQCKEGYGPQDSLTLTCKDGKWSLSQPCPLVDCTDDFPAVANGTVDVVAGTTFGSTAHIQCNPGFTLNETSTYVCLADGYWSSDTEPLCIPHPCGPHNLSNNVLVREDFSHINMTMGVQCEDGFEFASGNDTYIICENGTWINNPRCEVPGKLSLETQNNSVLVSGRPFTVSCRLTDSTNWETVLLARAASNISNENPLIIATNVSGNVTTTMHGAFNFDKTVEPLTNGILLTASFKQVQCSDTGLYVCAVLVGSLKESRGNKTKRRQFDVIDLSSQIQGISAEKTLSQGDVMIVRCSGKLGMDHDRRKQADLSIKIVYTNENTALIMPSIIESSRFEGCQLDETINSTIWVRNNMNGAELQCVLEPNFGEKQKKSVIISVSTTTVQVSTSSSTVVIGNNFNISAELNNIRGWEILEFRKVCSEQVVIARLLKSNENISSWSIDRHIVLSDNLTDTSANINLFFNGSICSDACGIGGDVVYISAVKLEDSWVEESVKIQFQSKPSTPRITTEQDKFYHGQEAVITCTGNVGIPGRVILMRENNEILPARLLNTETNINEDTCENVATLQYSFTVTDDEECYKFLCEITTDSGTIKSNTLRVNCSEPILYFTEESKTGEIGNSKTIQCVFKEVANLTSVVISRYSSESKLCEVAISGLGISGSCSVTGISVNGHFSENDSIFTTTVTLAKVSCESEGVYVCRTNTAKTEMDFKVTSNVTVPYLRLPITLVEDQPAFYEEVLACTADLGYPLDDKMLKIEIKLRDSSSYRDYSTDSYAKATECRENASISLIQQVFSERHNGSTIRCVIRDKNNEVIVSSLEKTILLLKNVCLDGSAGDYDPHPFNCRRYIRCVGTLLYDRSCAQGSCAIGDSDLICNSKCTSCP